jgi:hypothetical protein
MKLSTSPQIGPSTRKLIQSLAFATAALTTGTLNTPMFAAPPAQVQQGVKLSDISQITTKEACLQYYKNTLNPALSAEFAKLMESKKWDYYTKEEDYR